MAKNNNNEVTYSTMDIWSNTSSNKLTYEKKNGKLKAFKIKNMEGVMASNLVFSSKNTPWFTKFNRYGNLNPTDTYSANREFLIFTKPDLWIYNGSSYKDATLRDELKENPKFIDWDSRHKNSLLQLQYSITDADGCKNPFMYLLSNGVTSKMDIPSITAENRESTSNIYGTSIQYRGHGIKSNNGYDFTLSFTDTAYLEIYFLIKAYDEYLTLLQTGENGLCPTETQIVNREVPEMFSIYKIIVGDDGETIMYYAKATGVYISDVPRSDFSDAPQDGFKFSVSFHAEFIDDNDPSILADLNAISPAQKYDKESSYVNVYDLDHMRVDNSWVRYPRVIRVDPRVKKSGAAHDYRLKWTN